MQYNVKLFWVLSRGLFAQLGDNFYLQKGKTGFCPIVAIFPAAAHPHPPQPVRLPVLRNHCSRAWGGACCEGEKGKFCFAGRIQNATHYI